MAYKIGEKDKSARSLTLDDKWTIITDSSNNFYLQYGGVNYFKMSSAGLIDSITNGILNFSYGNALTIASGVITVGSYSYYSVDTEGGASIDDLTTINGSPALVAGRTLLLRCFSSSRDVIVKNGTGNIKLIGDFAFRTVNDFLLLIYDGTNWNEVGRNNKTLGIALTITSGVITMTGSESHYTVDTEGGASSDVLDTINGGYTGQVVVFRNFSDSRDTTFKDGTGNLKLKGDCLLNTKADTITLCYTDSAWEEVSRSINSTSIYNGTIALTKLTAGGTDGSFTVENGLIISYTAPT